MRKSPRRKRIYLLAGLVGIGLLLRLIALRTRGIWYDDAFSIFLARQDVAQIVAGTAADTMPPLYYLLLHLWMKMGSGIVTLRLLNVLISLVVIMLVYRMSANLFDHRAAALAALFTAISPFQIYHAQELRMYGVLCLNLLIYLYFFSRIYLSQDRRPWVSWVGLVTGGALAMYSHNLAAFTLISADLFLLLRRRWRLLIRLVMAQMGILLLASPWLVMVPGQIAKIQRAFWTPRPGFLELIQTLVIFHTNLPVPDRMIPIAVTAATLFLVLVIRELVSKRRNDPGVRLLAAFALFPAVLAFGISYLMRPLFVPRGLILSSVAYYALGARAGSGRRVRVVRGLLVLVFVAAALMALPGYYTFDEFPRSPHEEAVDFLRPRVRAEDIVLHDNKLSYFPMHYYGPNLPQVFLPDEPGSHNDTFAPASQDAMRIWPAEGLETAIEGASRVWFVFYTRSVEEYASMGADHPVLEKLRREWRPRERFTFNDLEVMLFESR